MVWVGKYPATHRRREAVEQRDAQHCIVEELWDCGGTHNIGELEALHWGAPTARHQGALLQCSASTTVFSNVKEMSAHGECA